jgi:hypothetical protein
MCAMSENNGHTEYHVVRYTQMEQTEENWDRLREFMKDTKGFIPPAHLGVAAIAEVDGELVGGLILQMIPYAGPLHVAPSWRNRVDITALKRVIDGAFKATGNALIVQGYVVMTGDEAVARIAEGAGMKRLPCITLFMSTGTENVTI